MAKLTGIAKEKFLARLNKGRVKAGLKRIKSKGSKLIPKTILKKRKRVLKTTSKPKSKVRNTFKRRTVQKNVAKKSKRRGSRRSNFMNRVKKGLFGAIIGIAVTAIASKVIPQFAKEAGTIASATQGFEGVVGKVVLEQVLPRFNLGGFLGGNGNGNGVQNTGGFA